MTSRNTRHLCVIFVLFCAIPLQRVIAQDWTPPKFALGDYCQSGTDQLVEVLGSFWQFPAPCRFYVTLREQATRTPISGYPLLGDWNGDGHDTPGVFTAAGVFYLSSHLSGGADLSFAFGESTDIPVAGDWDGDGVDTVGVYRTGIWYLTNTHSAAGVLPPIQFGSSSDYPVAGDWDNDGAATIGLYVGGLFTLSDDLSGLSLTYVSMPGEEGHPVTFRDSSGDDVALIVLNVPDSPDEYPDPGGKIIIRPIIE